MYSLQNEGERETQLRVTWEVVKEGGGHVAESRGRVTPHDQVLEYAQYTVTVCGTRIRTLLVVFIPVVMHERQKCCTCK